MLALPRELQSQLRDRLLRLLKRVGAPPCLPIKLPVPLASSVRRDGTRSVLAVYPPVCEGVLEYKINWGPGYRVYFGRDGEVLVILLTGGTKKRSKATLTRRRRIGRNTSGDGRVRDDGG
jgi:putative addiction module killer protein